MKISKYMQFAIYYLLIQGIGLADIYFGFDVIYGTPELTNALLLVEIILGSLIYYYVRVHASWRAIGYGDVRWLHVLWLVPLLLLAAVNDLAFLGRIEMSTLQGSMVFDIVVTAAVALMIAFTEESMFRGILLQGALRRYGPFLAMIISAFLFTVLHALNLIVRLPLADLPSHLFSNLVFGLLMAPLALLIGNLIPLILFHFIYDFGLLESLIIPAGANQPALLGQSLDLVLPVEIALVIILWVVIYFARDRYDFRTDA
jgi:membrane protease YdiL (CAAX protease family)